MPTFDIACELSHHEIDNAIQQAERELGQRYDFKGTDSSVERTADGLVLRSSSDNRLDAARAVLNEKMAKRGVSLKSLDPQPPERAAGQSMRQLIKLREGIDQDNAKKIVKLIKDSKLKVQASIQGDTVRVTGKKRDDLQAVIAMLKERDLDLPLTYKNFRD